MNPIVQIMTGARRLQDLSMDVFVGGSLALWLAGFLNRQPHDIDLTVRREDAIEWLVSKRGLDPSDWGASCDKESGRFQSIRLEFKDKALWFPKICVFHHQEAKRSSFAPFGFRLLNLDEIVAAKKHYVDSGSGNPSKHRTDIDLIRHITGGKPIEPQDQTGSNLTRRIVRR